MHNDKNESGLLIRVTYFKRAKDTENRIIYVPFKLSRYRFLTLSHNVMKAEVIRKNEGNVCGNEKKEPF